MRKDKFPNPAQDAITIAYNFANNANGVLQLSDVMGRVMLTKNLSSASKAEEIDVSGLAPGIYLYRITQSGLVTASGKLVKE